MCTVFCIFLTAVKCLSQKLFLLLFVEANSLCYNLLQICTQFFTKKVHLCSTLLAMAATITFISCSFSSLWQIIILMKMRHMFWGGTALSWCRSDFSDLQSEIKSASSLVSSQPGSSLLCQSPVQNTSGKSQYVSNTDHNSSSLKSDTKGTGCCRQATTSNSHWPTGTDLCRQEGRSRSVCA